MDIWKIILIFVLTNKTKRIMKKYVHNDNLIVEYGENNYTAFYILDGDIFEKQFSSLNDAKKWLDKQN